jgi:hypothetical protein
MPEFHTTDDIERHYGRLIKAEEDEAAKRELELEKREKLADFREQSAARRELEAHKREVVSKHDLGDLADFVTGNTPEEIEASAERLAEQIKKRAPQAGAAGGSGSGGDPSGEELYGRSGAAGGGTPPPPRDDPTDARIKDFEERFNAKDPLRPISTAEAQWYVRTKGGRHIGYGLADTSRSQSMRDAARRLIQDGVLK